MLVEEYYGIAENGAYITLFLGLYLTVEQRILRKAQNCFRRSLTLTFTRILFLSS